MQIWLKVIPCTIGMATKTYPFKIKREIFKTKSQIGSHHLRFDEQLLDSQSIEIYQITFPLAKS